MERERREKEGSRKAMGSGRGKERRRGEGMKK